MKELSTESQEILNRIKDILEDKRGVSVVSCGAFDLTIGGAPELRDRAKLAREVALLFEKESFTEGCKAYLVYKFMSMVDLGLPTDVTIDLSGIMFALQTEDSKEFEIASFLIEVRAILAPEAHDLDKLINWGEDILANYSPQNPDILNGCEYLKRLKKTN